MPVLKSWLPVVVWMIVIFTLSTSVGSAEISGGLLEPVLHWVWPGIDPETIEWAHFIARKGCHLTEYAILAVLLWRAIEKPFLVKTHPFTLRMAALALCGAVLYASTDEYHQSWNATRTASVKDVAIDSSGALLGLIAIAALQAWRRRKVISTP